MDVRFRDDVVIEKGEKRKKEIVKITIAVTKWDDGGQKIQLYRLGSLLSHHFDFYSIEEWDKVKAKVDRMIARAEEYNVN